jgi:hypothetical protein
VALNKYEAPPSPDYGNYLTQVDILHGYDLRGLGLRYNPLFFVLLDVFLRFFDDFNALKVVASFVFSIIAIPFFLFARKLTGSYLAALICTWLFVFFEGYSEMIAWGGNPNFLGFSFMLMALFFLVNFVEKPSRENMLLTGFFLSLVVGTHFLVAAFVFFSFSIFFVLTWVSSRMSRDKIIKSFFPMVLIALVFSLPYFSVYLTFFKYSSPELVGFNILRQLNEISSNVEWMFRTQYLVIAVMILLGVFALAKYIKENKNNGLLLCSLFLAPFLLALVTDQPGRWFYFLPIPIILCFGIYLRNLFSAIRNSGREIFLLAFCLIFIIGFETTISSINRLETAIDYYQAIGGDELQALRWIKENTATNAVFATSGPNKIIGGVGNSYSWWIEGYSKRKCIPAGVPEFFSYQYERDEVRIANRIFAGTYSIEYGNIRLVESFPAGMGNPEVGALVNGYYQNVLFLNDGEQQLVFSPVENEQVTWYEAPFYAKNKTSSIYYNESLANMTFTYEWPNLKLTRSVIIGSEPSFVDIIFQIFPINSTFRQFKINLWASFYTSLENYEIESSTIALYQKIPSNDIVKTKIALLQTNGELNDTKVLFRDPKYSMPVATYSFEPLQNNLFVHIRVSIVASLSSANDQGIYFYNSYDLIKDLGIDYIFLNKNRINEYRRFLSEHEHFTVAFENDSIIIFKVV